MSKSDTLHGQASQSISSETYSGADNESRHELVERVFNEHNETLLRFLRVRLQSDAEAQEVAQEAYVRLLKLDEPGAISYVRAFLFKIATHLAVDRMRQRKRADKHIRLSFFEGVQPSEEDTELVQEKIRLVNGYINELPPKCRKVFLLNRLEGLSTAEIAAQMLMSSRMVRKYLVRATEYCRTRLDEALGENRE